MQRKQQKIMQARFAVLLLVFGARASLYDAVIYLSRASSDPAAPVAGFGHWLPMLTQLRRWSLNYAAT